MRVIAYTKTGRRGPSSRYRFFQLQRPLRAHGIELEIHPLFRDAWFRILRIRSRTLRVPLQSLYAAWRFLARLAALRHARGGRLVIVEHQLFPYLPAWAERWLTRRGIGWVLEFDDAIHLTRFHGRKLRTLCELADHVIVGNETLAGFAREHARAVSVVPTTIDVLRTTPRESPRPPGPPTIGWIGLPFNFDALARLQEPFRRLAETTSFVLRVVSAGDPGLRGLTVEIEEWTEDREVDQLGRFDVGVMPLADDEWSRAKCGLKILQYFAAGVPVVASPVGVNTEIVLPGENGLLASTEEEWRLALERLLGDADLRRRLAGAGRATVEQRFSTERWVPRIAELWRSIADPSSVGPVGPVRPTVVTEP